MIQDIEILHPHGFDFVGFIPTFLEDDDPRPAAEQFNERYAFGGGWRPMNGWKTEKVRRIGQNEVLDIRYPGDPPYAPVARLRLRDETIWVYRDAWVAIEQVDGSVEIARMD